MLKNFCTSLAILLALCAAVNSQALTPDKPILSCSQDLASSELRCVYRILSGEPAISIDATAGAESLPVKQAEYFPWPGAVTAILILVDTSDPGRQNVIEENQRTIARIIEKTAAHHLIGLAAFDKSLRQEAAIGSSPEAILDAAGRLRAQGLTTELYRNVLNGIEILRKTQADRKAIYLLSDGQAEDRAYFHSDVVRAAREAGVVINSFGYPRSVSRSVALQTLRRLSDETGGIYIETDVNFHLPEDFLLRPFASMDGGGRFTVDLTSLQTPGTDASGAIITINTASGSQRINVPLALAQPAPVIPEPAQVEPATAGTTPVPQAQPPIRIITREVPTEPDYFRSWYLVLIGLLLLLLISILTFFFTMYRQGKRKTAVTQHVAMERKPYAYLVMQDETKKRYPITRTTWRIGRGSDNEMTLPDSSVSRRHAEIHRDKGDVFTIFDLDSLNGVFINNNKVSKQILHEGDIIEIGDISLRFTLHSVDYAVEDATVMQHTRTPLTH